MAGRSASRGDSRRNEHRALFGYAQQTGTLLPIGLSEFSGLACSPVLAMKEHLFLHRIFQQEQVPKGSIFPTSNTKMQLTLHEPGTLLTNTGPKGVLLHVSLDVFKHARPVDDAVVVALLEKNRAKLSVSRKRSPGHTSRCAWRFSAKTLLVLPPSPRTGTALLPTTPTTQVRFPYAYSPKHP